MLATAIGFAFILGAGLYVLWLLAKLTVRLQRAEASLCQLISDVKDIQDPLRKPARQMADQLAGRMYGQYSTANARHLYGLSQWLPEKPEGNDR